MSSLRFDSHGWFLSVDIECFGQEDCPGGFSERLGLTTGSQAGPANSVFF